MRTLMDSLSLDKANARRYFEYRRQIYASVNGRLGNLTQLSESKLLKKDELEQLNVVKEEFRKLSQIMKRNNG